MKFFKDNNWSNYQRDNKDLRQNINFKERRLYTYIYKQKRNSWKSKYDNNDFDDVKSRTIHKQDIYE